MGRFTDLVKHGHTHRPGGTDPIDGLEGLTYVATPNKHTLLGPELQAFEETVGVEQGTSPLNYTLDNTAPFGAYIDETSDGSWFAFAMPLGPRYSMWAVGVWYYRTSDGGIIELEWATTSIDQLATDGYGSIRSVENPPGDVGASWFYPSATAGHYQIDTYNAVSSWQFQRKSRIIIVGADGTMLSADGATATDVAGVYEGLLSDQKAMNGGGDPSVMWWLRLKTNGKNASSSGYRMRVAGVSVARIHADGNSIT